jgi:hypothetical protein
MRERPLGNFWLAHNQKLPNLAGAAEPGGAVVGHPTSGVAPKKSRARSGQTPQQHSVKEHTVSLVRLLPAWFHAIADYAVGITLIVVAVAVGGTGAAVATGVVVGAVVLIVSMLTRYPLGVAKVLPFTVHSAGDYLAAALLVLAPFVLGFTDTDGGLSAFYVVAGIAVLAVSLVTNYQYSPKREWSQSPAMA